MTRLKFIQRRHPCVIAVCAFMLAGFAVSAAGPSHSGDFTDRRITTGARIFRALLAADVDITRKTGRDGSLRLCLLYVDDTGNAEKAAEVLRNRDDSRIRKMNVRVEIIPFARFVANGATGFAGVFLTQALSDEKLGKLIAYAKKHKIAVFSPLEGDVERGVLGGIAVEARVRPYLNMKALHDTGVTLKSFFVRVAKQYEK